MTETFGEKLKFWRRKKRQTQLELGMIAGYSQRHISFLESGRSQPSRSTLITLCDALNIPLNARNELLAAAGFAPIYSQEPLSSERLKVSLDTLESLLNLHRPFPAIIVDPTWTMFAANENAIALFAHFSADASILLSDKPINAIEVCLQDEGLKPAIKNWGQFMSGLEVNMRQLLSQESLSDGNMQLLQSILAQMSDAPEITAQVTDSPILEMHLEKGADQVQLTTLMSQFNFPLDSTLAELKIETFLPTNPESKRYLETLDQNLREAAMAPLRLVRS